MSGRWNNKHNAKYDKNDAKNKGKGRGRSSSSSSWGKQEWDRKGDNKEGDWDNYSDHSGCSTYSSSWTDKSDWTMQETSGWWENNTVDDSSPNQWSQSRESKGFDKARDREWVHVEKGSDGNEGTALAKWKTGGNKGTALASWQEGGWKKSGGKKREWTCTPIDEEEVPTFQGSASAKLKMNPTTCMNCKNEYMHHSCIAYMFAPEYTEFGRSQGAERSGGPDPHCAQELPDSAQREPKGPRHTL